MIEWLTEEWVPTWLWLEALLLASLSTFLTNYWWKRAMRAEKALRPACALREAAKLTEADWDAVRKEASK